MGWSVGGKVGVQRALIPGEGRPQAGVELLKAGGGEHS